MAPTTIPGTVIRSCLELPHPQTTIRKCPLSTIFLPKAGDSFKTTHTFDLTVFSLAFPRGLTTPFTFRQGCAHPTWLGVHVSHLGPAPLLTGLEVSRGEHLHFSAPVSGAQQAQSYCHWAPGWGRRQASCFMHVNELHPYS